MEGNGMEWRGMEWNGMEWSGDDWSGVEWRGVELNGVDLKKATLRQGISHAIGCFIKMYILKAGFLDGKQGFLLAVLSAHSTFVKYADLWERNQH